MNDFFSSQRNLILDIHRDRIHTALKHAQQVEELSEYHNYLFTSLDLQTVDMEDYQYTGTNISSFSLMDESAHSFLSVINDWQLNSFAGFSNLNNLASVLASQNTVERWNVSSLANGFTTTRIWPQNFTVSLVFCFFEIKKASISPLTSFDYLNSSIRFSFNPKD